MLLTFTVEPAEIRTAVQLLVQPLLRQLAVGGAVFLVLVLVLVLMQGYLGLMVLCCAAGLVGLLFLRYVQVSRANLQASYASMGMASYALEEAGIRVRHTLGEILVPRNSCVSYTCKDSVAVLRQNNRSIFVFPQRAFTPDQWEQFCGSLQGWIHSNPR